MSNKFYSLCKPGYFSVPNMPLSLNLPYASPLKSVAIPYACGHALIATTTIILRTKLRLKVFSVVSDPKKFIHHSLKS